MKKFLLTVPFLLGSILSAQETPIEEFVSLARISNKFEAKAKYERYKNTNHTKLEGKYNGRIEDDSAWGDLMLKLSICDADTHHSICKIELDRCLVGYEFYNFGATNFYMELGRAKMESMFNSKLQYGSHFNGVHASFLLGDIRVHGGMHAVKFQKDQYAGVAEVSHTRVAGLPFIIDYSFTHWVQTSPHMISQVTATYFFGDIFGKNLTAYAAFLRNHKQSAHCNGGYAGVSYGSKDKAYDWLVDVSYQYAGDNSIPAYDYNGIGNGHGAQVKAAYCLSDHLVLEAKVGICDEQKYEASCSYKF